MLWAFSTFRGGWFLRRRCVCYGEIIFPCIRTKEGCWWSHWTIHSITLLLTLRSGLGLVHTDARFICNDVSTGSIHKASSSSGRGSVQSHSARSSDFVLELERIGDLAIIRDCAVARAHAAFKSRRGSHFWVSNQCGCSLRVYLCDCSAGFWYHDCFLTTLQDPMTCPCVPSDLAYPSYGGQPKHHLLDTLLLYRTLILAILDVPVRLLCNPFSDRARLDHANGVGIELETFQVRYCSKWICDAMPVDSLTDHMVLERRQGVSSFANRPRSCGDCMSTNRRTQSIRKFLVDGSTAINIGFAFMARMITDDTDVVVIKNGDSLVLSTSQSPSTKLRHTTIHVFGWSGETESMRNMAKVIPDLQDHMCWWIFVYQFPFRVKLVHDLLAGKICSRLTASCLNEKWGQTTKRWLHHSSISLPSSSIDRCSPPGMLLAPSSFPPLTCGGTSG
ncbi:alpha/beta-hydrolase, partial [Aureobasidium melanogenum]